MAVPIVEENYYGRYLEILTKGELSRMFLLEGTMEDYLELEDRLKDAMYTAYMESFDVVQIYEFDNSMTMIISDDIRSFTLYPIMSPEDFEEAKLEMGDRLNG